MERTVWPDERIDDAFGEVRNEMRATRTELAGEIQELRREMRAEVSELRAEMQAGFREMHAGFREMHAGFNSVRRDMFFGALALFGSQATLIAAVLVQGS